MTAIITDFTQYSARRLAARCRNLLGVPLAPEAQERVIRAILEPTQDTWDDAARLMVTPKSTLWEALLEHTSYPVQKLATGARWPVIPSGRAIMEALTREIAKNPADTYHSQQ